MSQLLPSYRVYVGWETAVSGTMRTDVSVFDGPDVFANAFPTFFTGALDEVTADIDGDTATIARGRDSKLGPISAGTFDFVLCRPNDPTYFDPNAASSPLHALNPGFVPMRPVKVEATVDGGQTYARYYGFIRSAKYDPYTRQCLVHCEDLLLWLSRQKPTVATLTNTTTQAAIGAILDASNWNDPAMRNLAAFGDALPTYSADGTRFALDLLNELVTAERGLYYVDAAGRLVYEDRNARSRRTAPTGVFTDMQLAVAGDSTSDVDLDDIINDVGVTDASGVAQEWTNLTSQQNYGIGEGDDVNSTLIPSGTGLALAQWEAALLGALHSPISATFDNDALPFLFGLELCDRIRVINSLTGSTDDYHIERIEETFGPSSLYLTSKLTLTRRGTSGFVFDGPSQMDGADIFVA